MRALRGGPGTDSLLHRGHAATHAEDLDCDRTRFAWSRGTAASTPKDRGQIGEASSAATANVHRRSVRAPHPTSRSARPYRTTIGGTGMGLPRFAGQIR